jgi:transcriptional regulator with XRE-family HTH domain
MGKANRPRPQHLAEKLLTIRENIDGGLSQNEMLRRLGLADDLERDRISKYERGTLDPPWYVLIRYAKVANVYLEVIVDDDLVLPDILPCKKKEPGSSLELGDKI